MILNKFNSLVSVIKIKSFSYISKNKLIKKSQKGNTFSEIFMEWYDFKYEVWSIKYRKEIKSMFESDILPIIGNRIITDVDPIELVNVNKTI